MNPWRVRSIHCSVYRTVRLSRVLKSRSLLMFKESSLSVFLWYAIRLLKTLGLGSVKLGAGYFETRSAIIGLNRSLGMRLPGNGSRIARDGFEGSGRWVAKS